MEGSGAPAEDILLRRPWLPVSISGCQLLAKSWFGETAYHILLTDMHCVWEERMDTADIQSRSQELNRRLRAPVKAFFTHLCEVVKPCLAGVGSQTENEVQISLTRQEDGSINMRLKSELAGLPFYWEFHCTPAPVALVCIQLVRPLLTMSRLLQKQVEQLGGLLVRKDAEIQDYRENGATLSRERLQTDVFEEQTHREDFIAKEALGFDGDLQELYTAIVTHGSARKRKLSEQRSAEEVEHANKEPELVLNASAGGSVSSESADGNEKQTNNGELETRGAKMVNRPKMQQSLPVTSTAAERPASKPKKKKVGLFR
ncbi:non-homologous end-joining factor 1 isoform X2 [Oreochromis aureus]|uniref:non-homologous end-joining factor 1 isoform X2 n=1 Tax=Oreochromis aureus TaxID=47969 RepID=UPI0019539AFD|nr:non-homologous end-joining factor 1 isoform X2 [Oreochromis aureus]